jgi:hypothetical protein
MPEIMLSLHDGEDTGADMLLRSRFVRCFPLTSIIALTTFRMELAGARLHSLHR